MTKFQDDEVDDSSDDDSILDMEKYCVSKKGRNR